MLSMAAGLFSLEGRVALVTGGSRGIGKMIAQGFVDHGAKVYISSRDAEACHSTAAKLGDRCVALPQDISDLAGVEALATAYAGAEDGLDILVNNAGVARLAAFEAFPEIGWDSVVDLNLKAPFFLTQKLHPQLMKAASADRPAKVINIASIDGLGLNPLEVYSYHASKAALIHLTRSLAARLARDHIVVNAIAPGPFASDMNTIARDHPETVAARVPLRRIGQADDIAASAIYLASRGGDYVVGATLAVDGGMTFATPRHPQQAT